MCFDHKIAARRQTQHYLGSLYSPILPSSMGCDWALKNQHCGGGYGVFVAQEMGLPKNVMVASLHESDHSKVLAKFLFWSRKGKLFGVVLDQKCVCDWLTDVPTSIGKGLLR